MQEIGTYFLPEDMKTYAVKEGKMTVTEGISCETGKRTAVATFASEVRPETFLEFSSTIDAIDGLLCMQRAATAATHYTQYEPEFRTGYRPTETANDGSYQRRHVACGQFQANREYRLPLDPSNAAITAGDYLELADAFGLDKVASGTSTCIALESVAANSGGEIFVQLTDNYIPVYSP